MRTQMVLPDPIFVTTVDGGQDEQLAALVTQQKLTHRYLMDIAKALNKNNEDIIKDVTVEVEGCKAASLLLRRELFSVRDGLGSEFKALNSELERSIGKIRDETAQQTSNKFASL